MIAVDSFQQRIPIQDAATVFRYARVSGLLDATDTAVIFHDLGRMQGRIASLRTQFPDTALHTVAIKANPLLEVLKRVVASGAGLEAASIEEVHLALRAGCPASRLVFDSPAKTREELAFALETGVYINADSFEELARISELRERGESQSEIGIRVNPGVGHGSIATTSVAGVGSRFGVSLQTKRAELVAAFAEYPWLTGVHVHVGSQGCPLSLLVAGVEKAWQLLSEANRRLGRLQVRTLDLGGGLPSVYASGDTAISFEEYASDLRRAVPQLFDSEVRLITEFGRAIQAGCGFAVARVEYVKLIQDQRWAVVHLGADFLLRPVYQPTQWRHEMLALDAEGKLKAGNADTWAIGGPLCFAGDVVAKDVLLPEVVSGDYLLIRDVGAYTLSLWSRHCSRAIPKVLGYQAANEGPEFVLLRQRETAEDVVRYWSPRRA